MAPIQRPALPYTISSPEWNVFSETVKVLADLIDDDASDWLHSVLSVFARVYTVSKIVVMILMHYGIEVCHSHPKMDVAFIAATSELTATIGGRHTR
jgi:hypothetical protein